MTVSPYDFLNATIATALAFAATSGIAYFVAYAISFVPQLDPKLRQLAEWALSVIAATLVTAVAAQIPQEWLDKTVLSGLVFILTTASNRGAALLANQNGVTTQLQLLNLNMDMGSMNLPRHLLAAMPKHVARSADFVKASTYQKTE